MSGSRLRTEHDAVLYYLARLSQGGGGAGGGSTGPTGPLGPTGATGGTGPPGANGAVISVANGAALTALSTASLVQGALALVRSRQTLWAYQPGDASAADGWHIPAAGGGNWVYVAPAASATLAQQTNWYVDIQNVETTSSDDNNGLTSATALIHKAEIARRLGANAQSSAQVTINYLSADTNANDTWVSPYVFVGNNAGIRHTAPLPAASFTGTLNTVTALNTGTGGNALQSTFTVTTGAIVANMLLVNTTRGNSRAFVQRNVSGGNWQITQPRGPFGGTGLPATATINTWASGDTILGYVLTAVAISDISAVFASFGLGTNVCLLWQIAPTSFGIADEDWMRFGGEYFAAVECVLNVSLVGQASFEALFYNCMLNGASLQGGGDVVVASGAFQTGATNVNSPGSMTFYQNTILRPTAPSLLTNVYLGNTSTDTICIDTVLRVAGYTDSVSSGLATLYGSGTLNVVEGTLRYSGSATGKLNIPTLQLGGVGTGYSNSTTAGVTTVYGGIALSAANLDAAAGAAGFGGYAFGGGAVITNGTQP